MALPDITNDFVGLNEEARQMGYFGRMVYAWVSPELALWGCRHWYGNPDFNPLWKWDWLTGGSPWYQCLYLWTGVALSFCSRRNAVTLVAWAVFLSFFLLPAKYIGYPRYVAQVHLAVVFAWFNFAAERPETLRRWLWLAACPDGVPGLAPPAADGGRAAAQCPPHAPGEPRVFVLLR